ncbi:MAG: hypothetical protein GXO97_04240 [Nitrospirae bacterium]|nr:hypothetical protein [Nitrospirota bacterium]
MPVGRLSDKISPWLIALLVVQLTVVLSFLGYRAWNNTSVECVRCHADKKKLEKLNASWAYVKQEDVEKESHHPYIQCRDCHLGNGRAKDKEKAHRGMLKMLIVGTNGNLIPRQSGYPGPLRESGDDEMFALMPKVRVDGELYMLDYVRNILWHDRDTRTFGFDPEIAAKTCGKSGCHPEELKQFKHTIMGRNYRQRTMRTWLKPYGPHNCGPSFADLPPPEVLTRAGFDYRNTEEIARELNTGFTKEQAEAKQKFCNVCHAGCLDCHYKPSNKKGRHNFVRKPDAKSCSGNGRGASTCHPGAMVSRRGETYIGGDYSIPQGMAPDVHYKKGIQCIDCHPTGEKGMGDMERNASCQDCHIDAEDAHSEDSLHKDMDCATCHISKLGGYQITIWGPGTVGEKPNPFHKYSLYYGVQSPPILMKDQKGIWMPVKVWPHSVGNIKVDVKPSGSVRFRWPKGETRDAYYIVGTFDNLPGNNKHLLWVEIEQAAHPLGKARECESCHASESQVAKSVWEFNDYDGADTFRGRHRIIADSNGLRFVDMENTTPIKVYPGYKLTDFASWIYLKDKWIVPGDFSIRTDRAKYRRYLAIYNKIKEELANIEKKIPPDDKKKKRRFKELKERVVHDLDRAEEFLKQYRGNTVQ